MEKYFALQRLRSALIAKSLSQFAGDLSYQPVRYSQKQHIATCCQFFVGSKTFDL